LRKHGYRGQRLKVLADLSRDIDVTLNPKLATKQ